jgi:hypothetical protein
VLRNSTLQLWKGGTSRCLAFWWFGWVTDIA